MKVLQAVIIMGMDRSCWVHRNTVHFFFCHFSEEMVRNGKIRDLAVEGISPTVKTIMK